MNDVNRDVFRYAAARFEDEIFVGHIFNKDIEASQVQLRTIKSEILHSRPASSGAVLS